MPLAPRIGERQIPLSDIPHSSRAYDTSSASTRRTDRVEKFVEYARAAISEYWLVDPEAQTIEVFVLQDEAYALLVKAGPGERAHSRLLDDFQVAADEAFASDS